MTTGSPPHTEGLTGAIARFVTRHAGDAPDQSTAATVRAGFVDTVATLLAGRGEPVVTALRRHLAGRLVPGPARVLFESGGVTPRDAAWVNATAGHALDYDDVGLQGHPSTVLVPALLAAGESQGASGLALMQAYVVGYEVWGELVSRDADRHHLKGWHPTSVFGVVAAAAAVAALRGLDADTCRHALGLAASQAGGVVANFGSMAKPLHAGLAAAHGIDAVDLACAGITASPDVLEHPAGFLAALSPFGRVDRDGAPNRLGTASRLRAQGLSIKKYPVCFAAHRAIDGVIDLVTTHGLRAEDVESFEVTLGVAQAAMLRNHRPQTPLEAKFSVEFAVAAACVAGRLGLAELDPTFIGSERVRRLMSRVRVETTDSVCLDEPTLAEADRVRVVTVDGRRLDTGDVHHARGTPQLPLGTEELRAKYLDCTRDVDHVNAPALLDDLLALERVRDVRDLARRPL